MVLETVAPSAPWPRGRRAPARRRDNEATSAKVWPACTTPDTRDGWTALSTTRGKPWPAECRQIGPEGSYAHKLVACTLPRDRGRQPNTTLCHYNPRYTTFPHSDRRRETGTVLCCPLPHIWRLRAKPHRTTTRRTSRRSGIQERVLS